MKFDFVLASVVLFKVRKSLEYYSTSATLLPAHYRMVGKGIGNNQERLLIDSHLDIVMLVESMVVMECLTESNVLHDAGIWVSELVLVVVSGAGCRWLRNSWA